MFSSLKRYFANDSTSTRPDGSKAVESKQLQKHAMKAVNLWHKHGSDFLDFPYELIVLAYRQTGKHFVSKELLNFLANLRAKILRLNDNSFKKIVAFLNVMLDKYDSLYDYSTYLALPLLELPGLENSYIGSLQNSKESIARRVTLLMSDTLQFDLNTLNNGTLLVSMPPDTDLLKKRCRNALKVLEIYSENKADVSQGLKNDSLETGKKFLTSFNETITEAEKQLLIISNIPVATVYDEYMFIRVLQSFEYIFSWIAVLLAEAIIILESDFCQAINYIDTCSDHLRNATPLFKFLLTIRSEAFKDFRRYTEGASAIQSESYKKIESLCSHPNEDRLSSIAYDSVPNVKKQLLKKKNNLNDVYAFLKKEKLLSTTELNKLENAMSTFSDLLRRWRNAHYGVALTILGDGGGTGYTRGTPYLKEVRDIPIFKSLNLKKER